MYLRKSLAAIVLLGLAAPWGSELAAQDHARHGQAAQPAPVKLFNDLGNHSYAVTTRMPTAQDFFNQGMRLYYAFNHQEAIRSFAEAQRLDPDCAMCYWGEALAWGPNINLPMDADAGAAAYAAIKKAKSHVDSASPRERAMIHALAKRYDKDPDANREPLDKAYAKAMKELSEKYPDDQEIAVLYAEAVMTTMPWDYWDEYKKPRAGVQAALDKLEGVIARNENHPGACHFYIHAVEKYYPERAVACAERLANLMPGAGHLVHMPGHIYIRVGRYEDAIKVNEHAVHADETYIQDVRPNAGVYTAGYYPHNYDFLAFAASMIGRSEQGIDAAKRVHEVLPSELLGEPGFTFAQHYSTRHLQLLVRFGKWDEILAAQAPGESLTHARAMWHYATGRAKAAKGDIGGAKASLESLREALHGEDLADLKLEFNKVTDILGIADKVLTGWIAVAEDDLDTAVKAFKKGAKMEDALTYGEPPEWTIPVRHDLGAALLVADRAQDAEKVFREDLERFPANGWSLQGLAKALHKQGRHDEAADVDAEFAKVWDGSDVTISSSVL